jgi:hypothetical protein
MASTGVLTAIQAALAGLGGGIEGAQQYRETERKRKLEDAALKRQAEQDALSMALNRANLAQQGWMTQPAFEDKRRQAGLGVGSAIASALNMAGGGPAITPQGDLGAAAEGVLTRQPAGAIDFGGTKMVLPETAVTRQRREVQSALYQAEKKTEQERQRQAQEDQNMAMLYQQSYTRPDGKPLSVAETMAAVRAKKTPLEMGFVNRPMTDAEQQRLGIDRERLKIERERAARESVGGVGSSASGVPQQDFSADLETIKDFLPTTDPKTGKLLAPVRKLSGAKTLAVQEGGPTGSFLGKVSLLSGSKLGADFGEEQTYNSIAQGIATAFAIAEQRGRNVSDKDVANRISQVVVQPAEVGNLEIQKIKGDRLRKWAEAVSGGNVQQIQPGATATPPVIPKPSTPSGSLPPDVDPQLYQTDAKYRAWVNSRSGR